MNERHTRTESGTETASRITPEEAARELTADHNFDYQDSTAASTSSQHLPEAVMSEPYHLPECMAGQSENGTIRMYVGDDPTPYTGVCICNRLRACEQRVRIESQAWHYKQGRSDALDAAETAVATCTWDKGVNRDFDAVVSTVITGAVTAIRALKEKK